ncbi:10028_t:CDS:2, partial [Cetraspora pellucida]
IKERMEELCQQLEGMNKRLIAITTQIEARARHQPILKELVAKTKKAKKEIYKTYPTSWRQENTEVKTRKTHLQQVPSHQQT